MPIISIPQQLYVYLHNVLVGTLKQNHGKLEFTYDKQYINEDKIPISLSLPLQEEKYDDYQTRAFFENLLPEGALLRAVSKAAHIDRRNVYGLLWKYGKECAGALTITDEKTIPDNDNDYIDISNDLKEFLSKKNQYGFLYTTFRQRLSLAGGQDKLPVKYEEGKFFIPKNYAPTTHILKPDIPGFSGSARNEAVCLDIVHKIGLPVCEHEIVKFGNNRLYLSKRFDRSVDESTILRFHQEDLCQAMGLGNAGKYQADGQFDGIKDIIGMCNKHNIHGNSGLRVNEFFEKSLLANLIVGNMDGHLKNYSLIYISKENIEIAPLYDVACTTVYKGLSESFGIAIGSAITMDEIDDAQIDCFANDIGIDSDKIRHDAITMAETALQSYQKIIDLHREKYGDDEIYYLLEKEISKHAKKIIEIFSDSPEKHEPDSPSPC